jgi:hypothetical protein
MDRAVNARAVVGTAIAILIAEGVPLTAQSQPGIGEVARRTAEERAANTRPSKVYTNADLAKGSSEDKPATDDDKESGGYISKTSGTAAAPEEILASSEAELESAAARGAGEEYWRREAASLRQALDRARRQLAEMENAPPQRSPAMQKAAAQQRERAVRALEQAERRWAAFETSAVAAKVPAAWLEPQ